ncbi:hypothetical protein LMG9673_04486 [Ralstonia pseudosolanacearum]|nr:hypothetical protein LMG9673_04486 [Ralstonia pseudosolanacearum]
MRTDSIKTLSMAIGYYFYHSNKIFAKLNL